MQGKALLVLVLGALVLGSMSVFTVDQRETALKLQLGKIKQTDYKPGLHFKLPLFQEVLKFDERIQTLDSEPALFLTNEKKNLKVDSFVKWRIQDTSKYYTSTGGNAQRAADRLAVVIQKRMKDEFGKRTIHQVVSGQRAALMTKLTEEAKKEAKQLGIEIVDVRLKRIDLPEQVSQSVFQRMSAERTKVAKKFRSEGEEKAKTIRAEADRTRQVLLAEARRDGDKTRGAGDAKATQIYADAFGQDPEFFALYRSLNAYKDAFSKRSDILLIDSSSEFMRYFKDAKGGR